MKKLLFTALALLTALTSAVAADSHITVDSEKIFKSLPEYNAALKNIEAYSKSRQTEVDAKYSEVETMFNNYAQNRAYYTPERASQLEAQVLAAENNAKKLQESYFGKEGTVMKYRLEQIEPIQKRVFETIETYAKSQGAQTVLDKASNSSILYSGSEPKHTQAIINLLAQ